MVRAFAVCAVILAGSVVSAQSVKPRVVYNAASDEKLGTEVPEPSEPTPVSACGKRDCPAAEAATAAEKPADKHTLLKQKLAEMNCLQSEIDALRAATGTPQQILLKLKVIEFSRTKLRESGIDIAPLRGEDGGNPLAQTPPGSASFSGFTTINDTAAVVQFMDHLRENNIAKVLAEPNLVAVSGRPAQFNVGGEVPLPLPKGSQQTVEYKPIGTQVDLLAIAQGENRVRLELRARVSEIDGGRNLNVDGVSVPSFSVKQVDTGLDLRFGQTGVLSGMLETRIERQQYGDKIVDVDNEIELLFLVTPELVDPVDISQQASARDATAYRTAKSKSDERPGERSLRVTKPYTPR